MIQCLAGLLRGEGNELPCGRVYPRPRCDDSMLGDGHFLIRLRMEQVLFQKWFDSLLFSMLCVCYAFDTTSCPGILHPCDHDRSGILRGGSQVMKGHTVSSWSTCHMRCWIPSSPSEGPCVGAELAEDLTDVTANHQSHKQRKRALSGFSQVTLCLSLSSWGPRCRKWTQAVSLHQNP